MVAHTYTNTHRQTQDDQKVTLGSLVNSRTAWATWDSCLRTKVARDPKTHLCQQTTCWCSSHLDSVAWSLFLLDRRRSPVGDLREEWCSYRSPHWKPSVSKQCIGSLQGVIYYISPNIQQYTYWCSNFKVKEDIYTHIYNVYIYSDIYLDM